MKLLVTDVGTFGPFEGIEQTETGFVCDGTDYPSTVIGNGAIQDQGSWQPPSPPVTESEAVAAVQERLDSFAQTRGYDDILSAATYATSSVLRFSAEGKCCIDLRDATWQSCYQILADVQAGTRLVPTLDQLLSELPALTWPA